MTKSGRPQKSRRNFLNGICAGAAALALARMRAQETDHEQPSVPIYDRTELATVLRRVLVSGSVEMYGFAEEVYATCVLGKIYAPNPPLKHAWLAPGGKYYGQWLWDTTFVADLLAILPGQTEVIRGVYQNYWDFQKRWDALKPEFMRGMIPNFIMPDDAPGKYSGKDFAVFPAYSQAPLLARGMERVYRRNGDRELLRAGLAAVESFHEWYWRERDITGIGLIGVGAYSGIVREARLETYDREVDLDGLRMRTHPGRATGPLNGAWYGDLAIPANTAYLLLSERSLERMARVLGDAAMAARRRARYERGAAAMRAHMWDQGAGCFLAVNVDTLERSKSATVGGFMALTADVPTQAQAARMAEVLAGPRWATPVPVPTVARDDAAFASGTFWRGDAWPAPNYQLATGLAAYGRRALAERIADATVATVMRSGISERYDSVSGAALGVAGLGMSGAALTMVLDGLTSGSYRMRVRTRSW